MQVNVEEFDGIEVARDETGLSSVSRNAADSGPSFAST